MLLADGSELDTWYELVTSPRAKKILQFVVSSVLVGYLVVYQIDINKIWNALQGINLRYYGIAFALAVLGTVVSVARWQIILKHDSVNIEFSTLLKLYYVGIFYNMLLPGSLSGDVVRAYKTTQNDGDSARQLASVVTERFSGLIALLLIGVIGLSLVFDQVELSLVVQFVSALLLIVVILTVALSKRAQTVATNLMRRVMPGRVDIVDRVETFGESVRNIRDLSLFVKTIFLSTIFIIFSLLVTHYLARALGVPLPILYLAAVMPTIRLVSQLPVSIGGLGVREGLYVYFFGLIGVEPETSVLVGLVGISIQYVLAVVGGVVSYRE